jgi:hypothetical protein
MYIHTYTYLQGDEGIRQGINKAWESARDTAMKQGGPGDPGGMPGIPNDFMKGNMPFGMPFGNHGM